MSDFAVPSSSGGPATPRAGLRLEKLAYWSQQVALNRGELSLTDYDEIVRRRTARRIALEQFEAARGR